MEMFEKEWQSTFHKYCDMHSLFSQDKEKRRRATCPTYQLRVSEGGGGLPRPQAMCFRRTFVDTSTHHASKTSCVKRIHLIMSSSLRKTPACGYSKVFLATTSSVSNAAFDSTSPLGHPESRRFCTRPQGRPYRNPRRWFPY